MKFTGTITAVSALVSGTSKSGKAYSRQEYVLTYDNSKPEWPKAIVFSVMNDNIGKFALQIGREYEVEVDFSAREWQDKFYLSASCWKAAPAPTQQGWQAAYPQPQYAQPQYVQPTPPLPQGDDLPF